MVITLENMLLSNMFMNPLPRISSFNYLTNSVGPGEPVKMDGEISVVQAKADSREMKKNEIGVEFEIKLSDQEVFESVWMRKVGNGTVVLEVFPHLMAILNADKWGCISTNGHLFRSTYNYHDSSRDYNPLSYNSLLDFPNQYSW